MIMNEELCDRGVIKVGASVKPAYMPQIITFENEDASVLNTLRFETGVSEEKARSILARFHFRAGDVTKTVKTLSGGEKSRLKLCLMMQNDANFLLLDEPTNHLDIASREWIENALTDFGGTMLFVSHDRYFLNKFAAKVWSMDNGVITKYENGYEEYLEEIRSTETKKIKSRNPLAKEKIEVRPETPEKSVPTETLISDAEIELKNVNTEIESDISKSDFLKMNTLYEKKRQIEERIDFLYNEWFKSN
jgi:ABC-type multidrug transport system ATPase subunit